MTRAEAIAVCVRDELEARRADVDGDRFLRSIAFVVTFVHGEPLVRLSEMQRFSVRELRRRDAAAPFNGSRAEAALASVTAALVAKRAELDRDESLRRVTLIVKFEDGGARVASFERINGGLSLDTCEREAYSTP